MQYFFRKALNDIEKSNPNFRPLTKFTYYENEQSFIFSRKYNDKIDVLNKNLYYIYNSISNKDNIDKEISLINIFLNNWERMKDFCNKTSKGGIIYFIQMYEESDNSKTYKNWFEIATERLKYLNENYSKVKEEMELKENTYNEILELIKLQPGIYQKDLNKLVNGEHKNLVTSIINQLVKENKVRREKDGKYIRLFYINDSYSQQKENNNSLNQFTKPTFDI